jgi:hypothetical protein
MVYKYNIDDFINISNDYQFNLNNEILNNIKYISDKINDPKYTRLPQFKKHNNRVYYNKNNRNNRNNRNNKNNRNNNVDLNILRNYKKTVINKNNGIELNINNIKNILNKLSKNTYINTINDLDKEINNILNINDNLDENLNKISNAIFKICSSNKFFSDLYSELYSNLYRKYEFIKNNFNKNYSESKDNYKDIDYVDSEEDYDKYCEINKNNDIIKSHNIFIANLVNNNILQIDTLFKKIIDVQNYIFELININKLNNKFIINELSHLLLNVIENINNIEKYNNNENLIIIKDNINKILELKSKKIISNNIIFKYLDILDKFN